MFKEQRRQSKEAATREMIADALAAVINREDAVDVSVDMIAKETGLSKGGIFYYYPNKTELMLSLVDRYAGRFLKRYGELMQAFPETRDRQIKAVFTVLFENIDYEKDDQLFLGKLLDIPEIRVALAERKLELLKTLYKGVKNPENITLAYLLFDGLWIDMLLKQDAIFAKNVDMIKSEVWQLLGRLEYED